MEKVGKLVRLRDRRGASRNHYRRHDFFYLEPLGADSSQDCYGMATVPVEWGERNLRPVLKAHGNAATLFLAGRLEISALHVPAE